jgi:nucleotide-binding universal stress UspA family protein
MGCYRTILAAVDGSADAAAALQHAAALAFDQHARLVVLTVVPSTPPPVATPGAIAPPALDSDDVYARILRDAVEPLPSDIGVQTRISRGRPGRRIVEIARESGADLIVMGFHGHGRLHHALIGSTSDAVLRESTVPVLLMRATRAEPAADPALRAAFDTSGTVHEWTTTPSEPSSSA